MLYKIKRQVTDACRGPRGMQNDFFTRFKAEKLSKSIFFFSLSISVTNGETVGHLGSF